jgi:hypothetical protein
MKDVGLIAKAFSAMGVRSAYCFSGTTKSMRWGEHTYRPYYLDLQCQGGYARRFFCGNCTIYLRYDTHS